MPVRAALRERTRKDYSQQYSEDSSSDSAIECRQTRVSEAAKSKKRKKSRPTTDRKCQRKPTVMTATRPMERQPMREWLKQEIDKNEVPGLEWLEKDRVVRIPWKHAARHGWSMAEDACLFERYAIHTGIYKRENGDDPNPRRWKQNFRSAINSLDGMLEVTHEYGGSKKGQHAFKVYSFLSPEETKRRKAEKQERQNISRSKKCKEGLKGCEDPTEVNKYEMDNFHQHTSLNNRVLKNSVSLPTTLEDHMSNEPLVNNQQFYPIRYGHTSGGTVSAPASPAEYSFFTGLRGPSEMQAFHGTSPSYSEHDTTLSDRDIEAVDMIYDISQDYDSYPGMTSPVPSEPSSLGSSEVMSSLNSGPGSGPPSSGAYMVQFGIQNLTSEDYNQQHHMYNADMSADIPYGQSQERHIMELS